MLTRPRPQRRLTAFFFSRSTSTSTTQPNDSIFTAPESPWDHVFSDIDPPDKDNAGKNVNKPLLRRGSHLNSQRASLTAREMSVFDEMFDLIFNAVEAKSTPSPRPSSPSTGQIPSIGRAGAHPDIFRTLRRHTPRVRWTTAIDEELDRKKETMELFNTDHELFQWITTELFGESRQWDEVAKQAIAKASSNTEVPYGSTGGGSVGEYQINHSLYPHLIAHAMRIFRTTYSHPSLSLAIFNHAARVSVPSYVYGCTAPAYNELMEAKWEGWGDLVGVCAALEEMKANGVKTDGRTRIVVEKVRREIGEARKEVNLVAKWVWDELGEEEVMRLVHRIEQLALRDRRASRPHGESWKGEVFDDEDGWRFDGW